MRILIYWLLSAFACYGQSSTFSRTYNDTMGLAGLPSAPVEFENNKYFIASNGFGLSVEEGGYQRIMEINENGEITNNNLNYTAIRRYYAAPRLIRSKDNNLLLGSGRTALSEPGSSQLMVQKISLNLKDTLWSYFHPDSLEFDIVRDLIELSDGSVAVTGYRDFSVLNQANSMDVFLLKLSAEGGKRSFFILIIREEVMPLIILF
jgi:hypothetical protein